MIEGGHPLGGRVRAAGNKNGALPILAACLLTDEPVVLGERAADRRRRDDDRAAPAASAPRPSGRGRTRCASTPREITTHEVDEELADRIRALVPARRPAARARSAARSVPPPGGDVIGRRRLDPHLHAFERARRRGRDRRAATRCAPTGCAGTQIFLDEASVMATENTVMAAVARARRDRRSMNAACEPHVQDLCRFLVSLGARIEGIGSNVLRIDGRRRARAAATHRIGPEHIEVGELHRPRRGDRRRHHDRGRRARTTSSRSCPAFERLGVRVELGRRLRSACRPDQELVIRDDLGG